MGYRGRLLHPLVAEVAQYAPVGIEPSPPALPDMDDEFREPLRFQDGNFTRAEIVPHLRINVQVEPEQGNKLNQVPTGHDSDERMTLTAHAIELNTAGLLKPNGWPSIQLGDRLVGLFTAVGEVVFTPLLPMFCVNVEPRAFGLGGNRNLFLFTFEERPTFR